MPDISLLSYNFTSLGERCFQLTPVDPRHKEYSIAVQRYEDPRVLVYHAGHQAEIVIGTELGGSQRYNVVKSIVVVLVYGLYHVHTVYLFVINFHFLQLILLQAVEFMANYLIYVFGSLYFRHQELEIFVLDVT